ncbi:MULTISPECIES: SGNH/GDSL hydrolase family protein [unclassified Janthinobacterium]|uniref:SGNH/GDSL hydrolase family protein n=1 Tax=unclassified Janthinobacterium TaxID=2610881 RepID=UPI00196B114B|nr:MULTISPECIES: SGNH/GDSL hydrolase family protein [unclassified Janthinobacterium]
MNSKMVHTGEIIMHNKNVYWDEAMMQNDFHQPSILAIGDSWFWYPLPGGSLLSKLGNLVEKKEHYILAHGNNGAEAYDYVYGTYKRRIQTALQLHGDSLSAVFISGGGNDFAGLSDMRPLLLKDCSACTSAEACYRSGDDEQSLNRFLNKVTGSFIALIDKIIGATWNTTQNASGPTKIYLHNYDYARPTGIGIFGAESKWLRASLVVANVPTHLQNSCIRFLIDEFTLRLNGLVTRYPGRVRLVDSRGTLNDDDWANELHPTSTGFEKIAHDAWLPVLQGDGLAPK